MNHTFNADSTLSPLVAFSPHYDDAVFSCGNLLAAYPLSTVITVCTGLPVNASLLTDWDQRCGFFNADAAMRVRRLENNTALEHLNAKSIELGFLDSQYRQTSSANTDLLCDVLYSTLSQLQSSAVIFPLGLFHEDHIHVSDALLNIIPRLSAIQWLTYEDIPYCKQTERVQERIVQFMKRGIHITSFYPGSVSRCIKKHAVTAYASQFRGLGYDDAQPRCLRASPMPVR